MFHQMVWISSPQVNSGQGACVIVGQVMLTGFYVNQSTPTVSTVYYKDGSSLQPREGQCGQESVILSDKVTAVKCIIHVYSKCSNKVHILI